MTKINYTNVAIYNHEKQDFIAHQHMVVDTDTGKIVEVGNGSSTNQVIDEVSDMHGRFVMPGIMNAHTHITSIPTYWWNDGKEQRHSDSREFNTMFAVRNMEDAINHGITYIRNVGAAYDIDIEVKKMQEKGWIKGPKVMTSGKAFSITGGHGSGGGYEVDGVDEVRKGVRQAMKNGVDNIKMMVTGGVLKNGETPDDIQFTSEEAKTAVIEAHHKGKTAAAHAQGNAGVKEAVEAGFDTIEHAFDIDDETIEMMKAHGTVIVPTMNAMYAIYKYGENTVPDWAREKVIVNIKKHFASITKAVQSGIPIAMGTDAGTPYNGFRNESAYEMELYVEKAGMTPAQAIDSATINCARAMHVDDEYGQIAAGNYADFISMQENPIDDISVIQHDKDVYQNGTKVHAEAGVEASKQPQMSNQVSAAI
ncbi:imidazolonepropionase [Lentilactobacillus parabuchneri]|jgi:imidazolonepropionase-like amidohydrolase|uniref:Amidohydrolase family protein n=2 Tax=Lentilactobacillus parabuchneri TaxID=152331 RepID=A0A1X1FGC7_9LACO|nr:amidohydrolase family protein [Lentilactobacillus parabuchneri]APR06954.1 imidazolonepropionase [Lentilactobacillus parabuchneri]KRM45428.1 amidohydrolase [Lentilactobacillus parabuchneri DSM 5707 = NBRC 107865]KRN71672.1 amidohydrolase [Lentilactobacillus parabuchneri]MBW0223569.1 amidohydrolase family protein [Lentilactobacillus parabuchneri]MBW0246730.1 amidohydrolase family protein [Lentilactobacillus parabuchneri]